MKVKTLWRDSDGRFDLYVGDTYCGHFSQDTVTPLANALSEAVRSVPTEALHKALKVRTDFTDEDGAFDLYLGDTFLGRFEHVLVTPLANAITEAVKTALSPQQESQP